MSDSSLEAIQTFVEKAFIRLQAGDVLAHCLDESSTTPIQQVVEELVLAGPQSLGILYEILAETGERKSQIEEDIHQVFSALATGVEPFGVQLGKVHGPRALLRLTPKRFVTLMQEQGISDTEAAIACLQMLRQSRSLLKNMLSQARLLGEIEAYLRDWIGGLTYESARGTQPPSAEQCL